MSKTHGWARVCDAWAGLIWIRISRQIWFVICHGLRARVCFGNMVNYYCDELVINYSGQLIMVVVVRLAEGSHGEIG